MDIDKIVDEILKNDKVYKGIIANPEYCYRFSNYTKTEVFEMTFCEEDRKFGENMLFVKRGDCFLYEIITGSLFPILKKDGKYYVFNNTRTCAKIKYCVIDDIYEVQRQEIKNYINLHNEYAWRSEVIDASLENSYYTIPVLSSFTPVMELEKTDNLPKEQENDIFPKEKKEFKDSLISEEYQKVEILLNRLKDKDYNLYLEKKSILDNIIEISILEYENIKNNQVLILYDKETLNKIILNNLIRLETEIEFIFNMKTFGVDGNIDMFNKQISEIKGSLEKDDAGILTKINSLCEMYTISVGHLSFVNQINISKQISFLYLLAIKKYGITLEQKDIMISSTYISNYKNYLYLLIRELLAKGIIVTTKYELLLSDSELTIEDIMEIINDIQFVKKDIKKLELLK